jgi:hypothetical protein
MAMTRSIALLGLTLAVLPLAACVESRSVYAGYPSDFITYDGYYFTYEVEYDDHYGPIHDGYWGSDGHFYFRRHGEERTYRKGARKHFRMNSETPPGPGFRPMQVVLRPPRNARLPHFDGSSRAGSPTNLPVRPAP